MVDIIEIGACGHFSSEIVVVFFLFIIIHELFEQSIIINIEFLDHHENIISELVNFEQFFALKLSDFNEQFVQINHQRQKHRVFEVV
jgi:hypothetical protein